MQSFFPVWLQESIIAVAIVIVVWFFIGGMRQKISNGVETFYYAAMAAQNGEDIYASHSPKVLEPQYVYPPLFAVMATPLLHFRLMPATRLWLCFNVLATWLALWIGAHEIARRLQLPKTPLFIAALASAAFILSAGEVKTEWVTGQTDTLTLLAFTLGLVYLERFPLLSGLALGAGANIKYQTLFAVPYLAVRRKWSALISALVATVGVAMLPALLLGWKRNLDFLKQAFGGLGGFAGIHSEKAAKTVKLTWIRSVSITSSMGRLCEWQGINPGKLAFVAGGVIALIFLAIVWWIYRSRGFDLLTQKRFGTPISPSAAAAATGYEWVGLMVAWLAFGPEVARRHMFVLLLLNLVVVGILSVPRLDFSRRPLFIGLLVFQIGLRLPPSNFQAASTVWNGIGGPSWCLLFYYAMLLWTGLELVKGMRSDASVPVGTNAD